MEKRIYKIGTGKKLNGVCGGIAEYYDIDPVVVKLAFVCATVYWGIGVIIYLIAALIMPKKSEIVSLKGDL